MPRAEKRPIRRLPAHLHAQQSAPGDHCGMRCARATQACPCPRHLGRCCGPGRWAASAERTGEEQPRTVRRASLQRGETQISPASTHSQMLGLMGPRRRLSAARPCPPATQELGGQAGDPPLAPARACLAVHFTRNTLRAVQPQTVPPATTRPRPQRDPSCIRTGTVAPPAEQTGGPPALSQSPVTGR